MSADIEYLDALEYVLTEGEERTDRTGTGTRSIFGLNLTFDNHDTFPILTTKRVHFKSVVGELLWMLSGSVNVKELREKYGVTIWDEWEQEGGTIGPGYGHQWVHWGGETPMIQRTPELPAGVKATYLGVANGAGKEGHPLKKTWEGMIARCYDKGNISYPIYGGRGVSVCDDWLTFEGFARDAVMLPGYESKVTDTETRYVLDKDTTGSGYLYGPKSCVWITDLENSLAKSQFVYTLEGPDGALHTFSNPSEFCKGQGIPNGNISDLWTGRKNAKVRHGFRFVSKREVTPKGINQIQNLIDGIIADPYSRRHIVNAWNVGQIEDMALPPCHTMFQCYVHTDGTLDLQLYQRSSDMFLGLPFNIAQYALLQRIIAELTGKEPGKLYITIGDAHIYSNHYDQVREQLSREPKLAPKLMMGVPDGLDDLKVSDFRLIGYDPHPTIKAPVAV